MDERRARPEDALPSPHGTLRRDYLDRLAESHAILKPRSYLEIGVFRGASLRVAGPTTIAVGVDPMPEFTPAPGLPVRIFEETSDTFFARHNVRDIFGGIPVDLVLIDGMHHFENVLRDFVNSVPLCAAGAWIMLHDTLPADRLMAARPRAVRAWAGDVWKVVPCLREACSYLRIATIDTAPTGLTFVGGIDPSDGGLAARCEGIADRYARLDFSWFEANGRAAANVVPDVPGIMAELLSDAASSPASSTSASST